MALVAIVPPEGPRHRAHVFARDWPELTMSGLDDYNIVFACERVLRVIPKQLRSIGYVSASLLGRVRHAIARESRDRHFEDVAGIESCVLTGTASVGRRVAAARHA